MTFSVTKKLHYGQNGPLGYIKVTFTSCYFVLLHSTIKNSGEPLFTRLSAIFLLVCVTGFEPTTFWSVASRSLSYSCASSVPSVTFWLHFSFVLKPKYYNFGSKNFDF